MKPFKHSSGRWAVMIPAKLSDTGRRQTRYYSSEAKAREDVKSFKEEKREHGRSGVTAEQREWIAFAQNELGDLSQLPEIIRFWKRNGKHLQSIETTAAVKEFSETVRREYSNARTRNDVVERLDLFGKHFGSRPVHEISATDL